MSRLVRLDVTALQRYVTVEYSELDAEVRVMLDGVTELAVMHGVMDEADARESLKQVFVPTIAQALEIRMTV